MMRTSNIAFGLICLVLAMAGSVVPAVAHRLNAGLTVVERSTDGAKVEITHRLFAHDLAVLLPDGADADWNSAQSQQFIESYARDHFVMGYDGKPVLLDYIGAESDGEYAYIYFTAPLPGTTRTLTIWNTLLQDILPDQKNLTNVRLGDTDKTLSVYSSKLNPAKNLVLDGS